MKIALVSPYDFAYPGGVANHISSLERYLTRMGHEVKIIAPGSKSAHRGRFIPIGTPHPIPTAGSIVRITISLRLASAIKEVLSKEKFDIVHLHEPFMPMLCSAVLRFSNSVNIGTFHACDGRPSYNFAWPIGRIMLNLRMRKLHGKIAVSKPALDYVSKFVPGPYTIIPNGIDLEHFSSNVAPIDEFCDGRLNILFVGRLEKRKGLVYLIKAYQQVKQEIPDSRLMIVGPGTRLRRKYERWVEKRRLKDVIFVGPVPYSELPRYYKTADVFCAPATSRESFGIVLLEAMAVGKPVVASNIKGYASVVTSGQEGLLVPPKDSQALAQVLISLLRDKTLRQRMGEKGQLKAKEYSWESIAQRVCDYYNKVLGEKMHSGSSKRNDAGNLEAGG